MIHNMPIRFRPGSGALVLAALCFLGAPLLPGQQADAWNPPPGESMQNPKLGCAALRSLTGYEFTIAAAVRIPAGDAGPEHCRVSGQALPQIRFEVNLPTAWNRRLYMFGNGGYAGEPFDTPPRAGQRARALRRGFVSAATNTGHDAATEPLATFAHDRQKLLDYAFRSLHVTAETAKRIAAAYYGAKPARAYFEGCSTGGRQALILAQRFPDDFDGIVVGAPVLNWTGTMMRYTCTAQALAEAPIPYAKLALLSDRIYAKCDAADGVKDGLIDDPRRCDFQPARDLPACAAGADDSGCFTAAQIGSLEKIYGPVVSRGQKIFPGWPVGAEIAGPNGRSGWEPWLIHDGTPTIEVTFAQTFLEHMAFPEKDSKTNISNFDFDKDPARLEWIHEVMDATDPDLSAFQKRGGKMLMYYGWADQSLNAQMGVDYYESVLHRMGAPTMSFFRFFLVPGMFHCGGGVGTSTFDMLTPLVQWVEHGSAPDRIAAARVVNGKPVRTRPLCPYPQTAHYRGTGSIDDAENFHCAAPAGR